MSKYTKFKNINGVLQLKRKETTKTKLIRKMNKIYNIYRTN